MVKDRDCLDRFVQTLSDRHEACIGAALEFHFVVAAFKPGGPEKSSAVRAMPSANARNAVKDKGHRE